MPPDFPSEAVWPVIGVLGTGLGSFAYHVFKGATVREELTEIKELMASVLRKQARTEKRLRDAGIGMPDPIVASRLYSSDIEPVTASHYLPTPPPEGKKK